MTERLHIYLLLVLEDLLELNIEALVVLGNGPYDEGVQLNEALLLLIHEHVLPIYLLPLSNELAFEMRDSLSFL